MGQNACGIDSRQLTKTLNQLANYETDIQIQQENDNPSQIQSNLNFLKTQVIASWNILQQKNTNDAIKISSNYTFSIQQPKKAQTLKKDNIQSTRKLDDYEHKQNEHIQQPLLLSVQGLLTKKYKDQSMHQQYQNLEIDVSNFIKIRHQNIMQLYQFQQKIGQGTFGQVFRCVQKRTGEIRAIKVLKKKSMNNKSKMSFIAELDILKTLDHPNIVKLYDLFLHNGNYYVITQLCQGGCLQKYFTQNKGKISIQMTKAIMKQLINVLNYLYSVSVVHRDLKMENIVFLKNVVDEKKDCQIRIIDFGTATKVQKHKKNQSGLVGTLLYIAPQFTKGFFNQKCDIWSSGIIFYRLLFNHFPFKGRTEKDILNQICSKQIEWNRLQKRQNLDSALQLLKSMLDKNYLTRGSSKTLVQHPWIRNAFSHRASKQMSESAVSALSVYNRKNNFVSVIQSFLSFKKVTQQQRNQLGKMFSQIDNDNSGLIETQQLIQFFKQKYPQYKQAKIIQIVANVDKNNSGKIDFNEFITVMAKKSELYAQQALKQAFEYVDNDKTGYISKKQLKGLLKLADKRQIQEIFDNLDQDGDNQISFEQFRKYLLSM